MFHKKTGTATADQEQKALLKPLIVLDVDETLILGQNERSEAIDTFNHELIDALVQAGIKEVYLLTSFTLNLVTNPEQREEIQMISRLQLILHLASKGITVKALISNYDLVSSFSSPGSYYTKVIRPHEQLILDHPEVDLTDNQQCNYPEFFAAQEDYAKEVKEIISDAQYDPHHNVKAPLANLFFSWLKQNEIPFSEILFFDDRQHYRDAVSAMAEKHNIPIACPVVAKGLKTRDYLTFLADYYPPDRIAYPLAIADIKERLMTYGRNNPFFDQSVRSIRTLLTVIGKIQQDIQKNPRHEWTGACKALTRELTKQADGYKFPGVEKTPAGAFIKMLDACNGRLGKIFTTLAAYYNVSFQTESLADIKAREAKNAMTLEGEIKGGLGTYLPELLVSIVSEYIEPPTREMIEAVNAHLSDIQHYASRSWDGVEIAPEMRGVASLKNLMLNGIIIQFPKAPDRVGDTIDFEGASLERATLKNFTGSRLSNFNKTNLKQAELSNNHFSRIKFIDCSMQGAIATNASFVGAHFLNGTNLQNIVLINANLTGARMKEANMQGAQLAGAIFTLDQFTEAQILSFHYPDEHAPDYLRAIFAYMNSNVEDEHQKGFERARKLILSFIHARPYRNGQNDLLAGFLLKGALPDEKKVSSIFSPSTESNPNSLLARLKKVEKEISAKSSKTAHPVARKGQS